MASNLLFGNEARRGVAKGIKVLSDAVRCTLGPKGRNVLIEQDFGAPLIINDGVTIAKNIKLKNKVENLGAKLIIEAATKTNDDCGDGTTTAVILSSEAILEGLKYVEDGINPVNIKEGFDYYIPIIEKMIKSVSRPINSIDDLKMVASISSDSEAIGRIVADAYDSVGLDGAVSVEEAKGVKTYLDIVKGYQYDRGYASSYMINNETKQMAILQEADILIIDKKLTSMKEIMKYLEHSMKQGTPLLIICDDIEQEVLSSIVMNKLRGVFNVVVTKAPSFGNRKTQYLEDIAKISNALVLSSSDIDKDITEVLGHAKTIKVSQNNTVIIDGAGEVDSILKYVDVLKGALQEESSSYEQEILTKRIANILGGVALIKVGASNEVELNNLKLRIEDAVCATRAAMLFGIIDGGGKVLYDISNNLPLNDEYLTSYKIITKVLKQPFYQILVNAGEDINKIQSLLNSNVWYDAKTKSLIPLSSYNIIDPAGVTIAAISHSLSIAGIVLTSECAITIDNEEKNEEDLL